LAFLVDAWRQRPELIQSRQFGVDYAEAIINALKKGCREYKSKAVSFTAINLSFYLLAAFTQERNMYAPILFKAMTFILIDCFVNVELRTEITKHFATLFREFQGIPIQILCEPLLKQITFDQEKQDRLQSGLQRFTDSLQLNTSDFELFKVIAIHPKLSIESAIQILEIVCDIAR
jgi:hypothetical protein